MDGRNPDLTERPGEDPGDLPGHVARQMDALFAPEDGGSVAVAVSGGSDSLAAALLVALWARDRQISFCTLTVDHGLRAGSAAEARQVAEWMKSRMIPHAVLDLPCLAGQPRVSQNRARQARYQALAAWCLGRGIRVLVTGHQADDQMETFLMRLDRASGPFGLAGMRARTVVHTAAGMAVLRPLLGVRPKVLQSFLHAAGQPWLDDPSNQDPRFARTRYRAMVKSLEQAGMDIPSFLHSLGGLGAHMDAWDQEAARMVASVCTGARGGGVVLDRAAWNRNPRILRQRAVWSVVQQVGQCPLPPRHSAGKILRILERLEDPGWTSALTFGGCVIRAGTRRVTVMPERRRPSVVRRDAPCGQTDPGKPASGFANARECQDHGQDNG